MKHPAYCPFIHQSWFWQLASTLHTSGKSADGVLYVTGSDDGSNSPVEMTQRSPKAENNEKAAANIAATMLFNMGGVMEPPCMPTPPSRWNTQQSLGSQVVPELPNPQVDFAPTWQKLLLCLLALGSLYLINKLDLSRLS